MCPFQFHFFTVEERQITDIILIYCKYVINRKMLTYKHSYLLCIELAVHKHRWVLKLNLAPVFTDQLQSGWTVNR